MGFENGNDLTGTIPTHLIGGVDTSGKIRAIVLTNDGSLKTSGESSVSGNSSATSSNQEMQIMRETEIRDRLPPLSNGKIPVTSDALLEGTDIMGAAMPSGGASGRGWLSAIWKLISDRLPSALVGDRLKVDSAQSGTWNVNVLSAPSPATIYGAGTQNIDTISILATGATYTGVSRNTSFL
ncbi:hypothetical protein LC605_25675, partial [Nostoc sp. CHAB 5836]|uniref:hypothetical protein n=1 Tax=Nostoc sp. CHAB 5836 TaxID=2780404 RepID=UPI001E44E4F8